MVTEKDGQTSLSPTDTKTADTNTTAVDPVAGKTVSEILGEIVWLMTQDASAKNMAIRDIERLIMPAILLRQFHIQYAHVQTNVAELDKARKATGLDASEAQQNLQPVSVEVFAMCSEAVSAALEAKPDIALTIQDWRSGSTKRVLASFSIADKLNIVP